MISINIRIYAVLVKAYTEANIFLQSASVLREVEWGDGIVWSWSSWSLLWMEEKGSEYHKRSYSFGVCLGRIQEILELSQESHGLWDFQINGSWIITKNLSLLSNTFDLRLLVCFKSINVLASKCFSFLFCTFSMILCHSGSRLFP